MRQQLLLRTKRGVTPAWCRVVAEIESASTPTAVIAEGLGATILPASMSGTVVVACDAWLCRIVEPVVEAPLALCRSDHLPLSEPAQAVREIVLELVAALPGSLLSADEVARVPMAQPERKATPPLERPRPGPAFDHERPFNTDRFPAMCSSHARRSE